MTPQEKRRNGEILLAEVSRRDAMVDACLKLIRGGAALDVLNDDRAGVLAMALARGHVAIVRALLAAGAPHDDFSPVERLMLAAARGDVQGCVALVQGGLDVNTRHVDGATALIWAARCGHAAVAVALRALGADEAICAANGQDAVAAAMEHGHASVLSVLARGKDARKAPPRPVFKR